MAMVQPLVKMVRAGEKLESWKILLNLGSSKKEAEKTEHRMFLSFEEEKKREEKRQRRWHWAREVEGNGHLKRKAKHEDEF